jgi:hypothetical protein
MNPLNRQRILIVAANEEYLSSFLRARSTGDGGTQRAKVKSSEIGSLGLLYTNV